MLPTESSGGMILLSKSNALKSNSELDKIRKTEEQYWSLNHLFILSDEEIKEGDWYIRIESFGAIPTKTNKLEAEILNRKTTFIDAKKIIATTDKSLGWMIHDERDYEEFHIMKQIPESFIQSYIKAYNEGNFITEVQLEYEYFTETVGTSEFDFSEQDSIRLKVTMK